MCGIAGVVGDEDGTRATTAASGMRDAMARRGPDAEGLHAWANAVLAHRRLAIFDLSDAGRQPMLSPDGRLGVVFNGAIYNFKVLRLQLEERGYTFRTQTDTEVLLHGYDAWGIDGLVSKLHGMFAFALWDDHRQTLYLVRDRLGVKPLLYVQRGQTLAFASTAAALYSGGFAEALDEQAVADFLEYGFVAESRCIYDGVHKLPPAHILRFHGGRVELQQYWQPPLQGTVARPDFEEAVERAEQLFLRAVEMRLEADVPVGALLSGGIDSALVCWAISKLGGDVTAFTIGTPGDPWDETEDARQTARELGIRHQVLTAHADDFPTVNDASAAFGEPFACASALAMLRLSSVIKQEATVLLTGDGGDDVFLGYPRHLHFFAAQRVANTVPADVTSLWRTVRTVIPKHSVLRRAVHFVDYAVGGLGAVMSANDGLPTYKRLGMLSGRLTNASVEGRDLRWTMAGGRRVLDDFIAHERRNRFVGEYLTKVDGATMYHALEARSPFLDQDLWTFAASLPYSMHLRKGVLKAILREIARRNIGERVAHGQKRGFGVPVQRWITGRWRKAVEEAFNYSILDREGWINADAVLSTLAHLREGETAPIQLWNLFVLENWMKSRKFSANVRTVRLMA